MKIDIDTGQNLRTATRAVSRRRQWFVGAVTSVVLAVIALGFYISQRATEQGTRAALTAPRPPISVEAATAVVEAVPQLLSGIGTLQAIHQVTVSPEVGGRVVKIFFEPGTHVKAGEPLVQLYDEPLRGDLANFEAQRQLATLNFGRSKELASRNFQSKQTLDQNQATLDQANAGIVKTKAQINQMLIRAPFDGELGVRQVDVGQYLSPGTPVVTLTDLSMLWVNFTLPEQAAKDVRVGQETRVQADAFPERVFNAKITAIEPQISAQTRTLMVQATLENPDRALLHGMFVKAEAVMQKDVTAVVLPETAVDFSLHGESAYVIVDTTDDKGITTSKVKRTSVKTGSRFDGKVTITSGLSGGERVVSAGQIKISDGAAVTVVPGNTLMTAPSTKRY